MNILPAPLETALTTGDDTATLLATITHFGCAAGTVHRLRADGLLHLTAHHHLPPPIVAIVTTVPLGKGIAGLAAEKRKPISLCNLQTDTSGQARPAAKTTGMEGSLAVPMLTDGELRGVLGIAKAEARLTVTRDGQVKGKMSYMAPEQLSSTNVNRRADVYAAGVLLANDTGRKLELLQLRGSGVGGPQYGPPSGVQVMVCAAAPLANVMLAPPTVACFNNPPSVKTSLL